MARLRDWIDLGRSTISSLNSSDVSNLYSLEWPETQSALTADHRDAITGERGRLRRFVRTCSAILFGLAKRLSPLRRILFVGAFGGFFVSLFSVYGHFKDPPDRMLFLATLSFLVIVLLLAMELIDKIKFRDELQLARELQASLVPAVPPETREFDIGAFSHVANTVGGDIYDFIALPDGRVAVLFGDASGHGMAAGLVMAVAHAAFRTQLEIDPEPSAIIASLNRILCSTGGSRSFFACCYMLLSPDGRFTATVAGHPPVLHVDRDGRVADHIGEGAYPLGIKAGLAWKEIHGMLEIGEKLVFHSDGLTETRNAEGREFGDAYVEAIVGWQPESDARQLSDTLVAEWRTFSNGRPAEDDVSLAVVHRRA